MVPLCHFFVGLCRGRFLAGLRTWFSSHVNWLVVAVNSVQSGSKNCSSRCAEHWEASLVSCWTMEEMSMPLAGVGGLDD